jgi:hypothetical protein
MATNIFNYNGTLLTTVQDGTISTAVSSIAFPGRGYQNYGEAVNQDMLWILQNFSNPSAPLNPVVGQLWYDSGNAIIKFWSGSTWIPAGGVLLSATTPAGTPNVGDFWYDTINKQLHIWSGSNWDLIGPLGSAINTDPTNPSLPSFSLFDAVRISDTTTAYHQIWRLTVGGVLIGILSKDPQFTPSPSITGFSVINPGLNLNSVANATLSGDSTIFKSTQNNLPSTSNTWNMGSQVYQFANMYAVNFVGTANSAKYADLAERYESDVPLTPGTVVILGGSKEVTAVRNYGDDGIFGVVSANPAYLMNSDVGNDDTHPAIALVGRVPCKVLGPVYKGQRLMASSTEGVAQGWDSTMTPISVLGRSLASITTNEIKTIEVVLGKN